MRLLLPLLLLSASIANAGGIPRPRAGEPAMDKDGDTATLPTKYPEGTWLPLEMAGLRLRTTVIINGAPVSLLVDTGAATTVLNTTAAHAAGLDAPLVVHHPQKTKDATGLVIEGYLANIAAVVLGPVRVKDVYAFLIPSTNDEIGLLGYDVLANVDLYFAFDEGLVGVFAPGKGPMPPRAKNVKIATTSAAVIPVPFDESGRNTANFILDTGSPVTTLEDARGDGFGLPVDPRFQTRFTGVGERQVNIKGGYAVQHFTLGKERVDIGPVTALRADISLLGNDVTLRHRTLLSSERATLSLSPLPIRPATRTLGPDGKACTDQLGRGGPCAKVGVDVKDNATCLKVDIDGVWAGRVVEGVVDVINKDGDSALGGGFVAFEAKVPKEGIHACVDPDGAFAFWDVVPSTTTSLLRFHTREKGLCPHDLCFLVTGVTPPKKP